MASLSSQHPPTIGGVTPASSAPVYRACTVRFDQHSSTGEPHVNKDDVLLFQDQKGQSWRLYAADQPGHYERLSTDTQLGTLDVHHWPKESAGSLAAIEAEGGLVDFRVRTEGRAVEGLDGARRVEGPKDGDSVLPTG